MLEMKKMARSIENAADAFLPLTNDADVTAALDDVVLKSKIIAEHASTIYRWIAKDAANA